MRIVAVADTHLFHEELAVPDGDVFIHCGDMCRAGTREELVRALALRLYNVDPITRRVDPFRTITGAAFVRMLGRIIALRGTPSCAAPPPAGTPEIDAVVMTLDACAIPLGEIRTNLDAPVSGRAAVAVLERLDDVLSSGK